MTAPIVERTADDDAAIPEAARFAEVAVATVLIDCLMKDGHLNLDDFNASLKRIAKVTVDK